MRLMTIGNSWKFSHGVNVEQIPYFRAFASKIKSFVTDFMYSMSRQLPANSVTMVLKWPITADVMKWAELNARGKYKRNA